MLRYAREALKELMDLNETKKGSKRERTVGCGCLPEMQAIRGTYKIRGDHEKIKKKPSQQ